MSSKRPGFSKRAFKTAGEVKFFKWSRNGFRGGIKLRVPYIAEWKAVAGKNEFIFFRHLLSPKRVLLETKGRGALRRWEVKSTSQAMSLVTKAVR